MLSINKDVRPYLPFGGPAIESLLSSWLIAQAVKASFGLLVTPNVTCQSQKISSLSEPPKSGASSPQTQLHARFPSSLLASKPLISEILLF